MSAISYREGKWKEEKDFVSIKEEVRDIIEDQSGNLWLGTCYNGLIKVIFPSDNKNKIQDEIPFAQSLTYYDTLQGLPSAKEILLIKYDDRLLFATEKGLCHFDEEKERFTADSLLGKDYADGHQWINRYFIDQQQNIWINGTEVFWKQTDGSLLYDEILLKRLTKKQVEAIYVDKDQTVWIGGTKGLFRYNPKLKSDVQKEYLTLVRKVVAGQDSVIYYGTELPAKTQPKKKTSLAKDSNPRNNTIPKIDFKNNQLTFYFSSPYFDEEASTNYSYILDGFDTQWSDWRKESKKEYTNLSEGDYSFKVKAKNIYGQESKTGSFTFSIIPPWYRSFWAYSIYIFLIIGIGRFLIKLRLSKLKKETFQLEKLIQERTSEIQQQKEKLSLQTSELKKANDIVQSKNNKLEQQKEEIIQQTQALQQANLELKKLSTVASETDNAIGIFNQEGLLEWVNEGFTRMYGYSFKQFIQEKGESIYWTSQNPNIKDAVTSALKNKKSIAYEFSAVHRNGQKIWAHTTLSPILDENGHVVRFVAIDSNISRLKKAEKEIKQQRDELERINLEKDNFFSLVAHDLRSPLGTLLSLMRVVTEEFDQLPQQQLKELMIIAHRSTVNTFSLLENLLEWALTQKGKIEFKPERVDINLLCSEVIDLFKLSAEKKNIQLSYEPSETSNVYCDENMIRTVLRNLLSNAIKFTQAVGKVIVSIKEEKHRILIAVTDNGIGITKDDISKIFKIDKPLSKRGTANERGTGIGLVLSKDFIQKNKGEIWVKSKKGKGSQFTFSLIKEKEELLVIPSNSDKLSINNNP